MLRKEEEKATRLSTACFQLLILFQVVRFIGVAKVRHLVLSLSRKVIEFLLFSKRFERAFKTDLLGFCVLFGFITPNKQILLVFLLSVCIQESEQTVFVVLSFLRVAFRKPNKRVLLFLSRLKSHLRSRTNVAADSGSRLANTRLFPRR